MRKEVTLIPITNISEACKRAVVFEDLNRGRREGNNPNKQPAKGSGGAKGGSSGGSKGGDKGSGSNGGTNNSSKGKGDKKKSNVTCTHCSKAGHTHAKCWKLHPELAPKKKGKGKAAMVVVADGVTNVVAQEADPTLSLMVRAKEKGESSKKAEVVPTGVSDKKREELFHFRIQVKTQLVDAVIDPGSQKNLISEALIQKLGLETIPHPKPSVGWVTKDVDLAVSKQCKLKFAVTAQYIDEMLCDVIPLDICQVIFGNPYLWDRDAIYFIFSRCAAGKSFEMTSCAGTSLLASRTMSINICPQAFIILLACATVASVVAGSSPIPSKLNFFPSFTTRYFYALLK